MPKINLLISICIFSILLGITSAIKNQTRSIEKSINKLDRKIATIRKRFIWNWVNYFYLSSPNNLSKKIKDLSFIEYIPMDFSRIYLNYKDFMNSQKKITFLKWMMKKKTKKK